MAWKLFIWPFISYYDDYAKLQIALLTIQNVITANAAVMLILVNTAYRVYQRNGSIFVLNSNTG